MSTFAKLFAVKGEEQVCIFTDRDEEAKPCLRVVTDIDGMTVAVTSSFDDTDDGWTGRDSAFTNFDAPQAIAFREQIETMVAQSEIAEIGIDGDTPA